ncbi:MAG TPA: DUF6150 family protein [bacterium]|nr:DUF6150 family protein [bacterium]HQG45336.1 DUF6150 family protein [bacterium]HQI47983.1 DUF6150 family protein [bacterium]HQJ65616.1 DUF6150 family protein [bacterium]
MPLLYKTDIAADADLKICFTEIRSEADLVAFESSSAWEATEPQIWCYTEIRSDAAKAIFITDSSYEAELLVFRTDIQSDAGWQNSGKAGLL